jgi:hypothetical protein
MSKRSLPGLDHLTEVYRQYAEVADDMGTASRAIRENYSYLLTKGRSIRLRAITLTRNGHR